jgi:hypothetical protein
MSPSVGSVCSGSRRARQQQIDQLAQAALDPEDAGRLERFQEARRQAQGDHVVHPGARAMAGLEAQQARFGQRRTV